MGNSARPSRDMQGSTPQNEKDVRGMWKVEALSVLLNTPWKAINEVRMILIKPSISLYLRFLGVIIREGSKFYGVPKIFKHVGSEIHIGKKFENRNWWASNPIGINHPTIICTWRKKAYIKIGNDVGISGGAIVSSMRIEIGDGTTVGANCLITDTDFHPIKSNNRRYEKKNIKSFPINIGKNVFIGTGATILKGATIPDNTIIPAGCVVRFNRSKGYSYI